MHNFGQLCVVWGIGIVAYTAIAYIVSVTVRPSIYEDPDNNPYKDEYG